MVFAFGHWQSFYIRIGVVISIFLGGFKSLSEEVGLLLSVFRGADLHFLLEWRWWLVETAAGSWHGLQLRYIIARITLFSKPIPINQIFKPLSQLEIIFASEDIKDIQIQLQSAFIEHFFHDVQIGSAVVIWYGCRIVLDFLLRESYLQHFAEENPIFKFLKFVFGVRIHPIDNFLAGVGHLN